MHRGNPLWKLSGLDGDFGELLLDMNGHLDQSFAGRARRDVFFVGVAERFRDHQLLDGGASWI
jgi:hypothetical protein